MEQVSNVDFVRELQNNIEALDDLSHCLGPEYKYLPNWRHFAFALGVPEEVIRTCSLNSEDSPTIRLFEYLQATRPKLTIQELRNALKRENISREDILKMIEDYGNDDKVSKFITESSTNILDQIALQLDSATRALYGWKDLGRELGVSRDTLKLFEMYRHNPTQQLLHHVCVTSKGDVPIISYLKTMLREDILEIVEDITQLTDIDNLTAKDIYKKGSELLEKICQRLNHDIVGVLGWRRLARLLVDDKIIDDEDIISKLEPPDPKQIHSPTKNIIEWIVVNREETTIQTLIEALQEIERNDCVVILNNLLLLRGEDGIQIALDDCITDDSQSVTDCGCAVESSSGSSQEQEPFGTQESDPTIITGNILQDSHKYDFGIMKQTIQFIGCNSERDALKAHLTQGEHQLVVLHGTPGSGKTTLLTTVAHELMKEQYSVIYVNSRGVITLEYLAVKILTTCGFTDVDDPIPKVKRLFETLQRNCILMIDNLDKMYHTSNEQVNAQHVLTMKLDNIKEDFKIFIKDICCYSDSKKLKVLVTSWEPIDYPSLTVVDHPLKEMTYSDCRELLESQLGGVKLSDAQVNQIISYCGGTPLLLWGAAKTIKTLGNVDKYCKILKNSTTPTKRMDSVCPKSCPKEDNFSNCLEICFTRMRYSTQRTLVLVSIFPVDFTGDELQEIVKEIQDYIDPEKLEDSLRDLREYHFLSYDNSSKSYSLHSAIRDFSRTIGKECSEFQPLYKRVRQLFLYFTLIVLIECEAKFFSTNCCSTFNRYRSKLENLKHVVNECITSVPATQNTFCQEELESACLNAFFNCTVLSNFVMTPKELKLLFCSMTQCCKQHGKTAHYFDCLVYGGSTYVRGCLCTPFVCPIALKGALWCFERAKEVLESFEDPTTIEMLRKETRAEYHTVYGKCLVRQGKKDEGLSHIQQGIDLLELLAQDSKEKGQIMLALGYNDLADAFSYCNQPENAIYLRQGKVIPTFEEILASHPFTAKAYCFTARDYHALSEYTTALKAAKIALVQQSKLLGDHRDTARSYYDLGRFLSDQIQNANSYQENDLKNQIQKLYSKALNFLQKALEMQQKILDSPEETIKTHREIAVVFTQLGKKEDAERHYKAIRDCKAKLESPHIDI